MGKKIPPRRNVPGREPQKKPLLPGLLGQDPAAQELARKMGLVPQSSAEKPVITAGTAALNKKDRRRLKEEQQESNRKLAELLHPKEEVKPGKDKDGFLRRWSPEYLKTKSEKASREFIPSLSSPFLRSLIEAQRNFQPPDYDRNKMRTYRDTAEAQNTLHKRLAAQLASMSDQKGSPEYLKLERLRVAALKASNEASQSLWRLYTRSRLNATEEICNKLNSQDPQTAQGTKLACQTERKMMEWADAIEQYNKKSANVQTDDILPQAIRHYKSWMQFIEELLSKTLKMPADFVQTEKTTIQRDFDHLINNFESQHEMRSIFSDIIYSDLFGGLGFFAQISPDNRQELEGAAELLSKNLVSGRLEGGAFIGDYLKMPASNPAEIETARETIKKQLIENQEATIASITPWLMERANRPLGTLANRYQAIKPGDDIRKQFDQRITNKLIEGHLGFGFVNNHLEIFGEDSLLYQGQYNSAYALDPTKIEEIKAKTLSILDSGEETMKIIDWTQKMIADGMDDFEITNSSLRHYIEKHLIPKILFGKGILTTKLGDGDRDVFLGTILAGTETIINQIGKLTDPAIMPIPVHHIVATHGTGLPQTYIEKGGRLFVGLDNLYMDTASMFADASIWQEDFIANKGLDATTQPQYLSEYFTAYLGKLANARSGEKSAEEKFREQYLHSHLTEEVALTQTKAFVDAVQHEMSSTEPRYFWGAKLIGLGDALIELLGSHSRIIPLLESLKERFDEEVQNGNFHKVNNSNYNTFIFSILRTEAKLQAIANAEDPIQPLSESLAGVIVPSATMRPRGLGNFEWLQQVLVSQLLTEHLIGSGIFGQVNWENLYTTDFVSENKNFRQNWAEFIKNPKQYVADNKDPDGLMRLRHAWYKFFNDKMGNFDKLKAYVDSGKLQEAVNKIVNREFKPYAKRLEEHPNWREYYQENLAFTAA